MVVISIIALFFIAYNVSRICTHYGLGMFWTSFICIFTMFFFINLIS